METDPRKPVIPSDRTKRGDFTSMPQVKVKKIHEVIGGWRSNSIAPGLETR
jgi:predicted metalloendopeptidase